jgi:hypothetical protein
MTDFANIPAANNFRKAIKKSHQKQRNPAGYSAISWAEYSKGIVYIKKGKPFNTWYVRQPYEPQPEGSHFLTSFV